MESYEKKKKIIFFALCIVIVVAMARDGKREEKEPLKIKSVTIEKRKAVEETDESLVERVEFDWEYNEVNSEGAMNEYATIVGYNRDGEEVWEITTPEYSLAQAESVQEIGISGNKYYYTEGGTLVALNLSDGKVAWKNSDYGGCGVKFVFDKKGTLYCSGNFGPDLIIIDKDGNTLKRIDKLNEQYHYPTGLAIQEEQLVISFFEGPYMEEQYKKCVMNLDDYSYVFPSP